MEDLGYITKIQKIKMKNKLSLLVFLLTLPLLSISQENDSSPNGEPHFTAFWNYHYDFTENTISNFYLHKAIDIVHLKRIRKKRYSALFLAGAPLAAHAQQPAARAFVLRPPTHHVLPRAHTLPRCMRSDRQEFGVGAAAQFRMICC